MTDDPGKKAKLLVVDDTPENIDILANLLKPHYRMAAALNGPKALKIAFSESPPDLILLDVMMPEMDGYEVCRRLKENESTKDIPVIFVTAASEAEDEKKGLDLGAVDYIRKPFNPSVVAARVRSHLELKKAREDLQRQNEILKENIRLREEVERISRHDLKTPLNAVISMPRIMIDEGGLSENQVEMLQMLEESGYRMLEIANSSLDLYKMETGAYTPHLVPVDLHRLVNRISGETREMVASKRLHIEAWIGDRVAGPEEEFLVAGEEMLCYSMLANLIKNAVEASPEEGVILINFAVKDFPIAAIHNQGVVPEEIRDRFFEKYATSGKEKGTGLGTYSAALIARTLGGDIGFESSDEKGTSVYVRFLPPDSHGVESPEPAPEAVGSAPAPTPSRPPAFSAKERKRLNILVVDDYFSMRRTIASILKQMGFVNFRDAEDGAIAKRIIETEKVDLVISDWNMPNMTGIELLAYVRNSGPNRDLPFIIISGESHQENVIEAAKKRVTDYIIKPFPPDTLKSKIDKILQET